MVPHFCHTSPGISSWALTEFLLDNEVVTCTLPDFPWKDHPYRAGVRPMEIGVCILQQAAHTRGGGWPTGHSTGALPSEPEQKSVLSETRADILGASSGGEGTEAGVRLRAEGP